MSRESANKQFLILPGCGCLASPFSLLSACMEAISWRWAYKSLRVSQQCQTPRSIGHGQAFSADAVESAGIPAHHSLHAG